MLRVLAIIGISAALAFVAVFLTSDPSTSALDEDVTTVRQSLAAAKTENEKYSGGLIKTFIEVRIEILRSTEAMLLAKRVSLLRRINLNYEVDGKPGQQAKLEDIDADIAGAKKRIEAAEQKAAQYSGGLIQVFALTSVETERITLAQLYSAYFSAKYDLPPAGAYVPHAKLPPSNPGQIVPDKEAL